MSEDAPHEEASRRGVTRRALFKGAGAAAAAGAVFRTLEAAAKDDVPAGPRGDSCPVRADGGVEDAAGIFGNQACASAHPSNVAPVLGALDAEVAIRDAKTLRFVRFEDFWSAPEPGRASDTTLKDGEVIEGIRVPARDAKQFVGYAEIRQREAFDWALVSCAVRHETDADGKVTTSRAWFGSLAPAPWRAAKAEAVLAGQVPSDAVAAKAGDAFLADATPLTGTTFKVQLAKVALKRALAAARKRA